MFSSTREIRAYVAGLIAVAIFCTLPVFAQEVPKREHGGTAPKTGGRTQAETVSPVFAMSVGPIPSDKKKAIDTLANPKSAVDLDAAFEGAKHLPTTWVVN